MDGKSGLGALESALRKRILTGIVTMVPLVVTFLALRLVFQWLDSLVQPACEADFGLSERYTGSGDHLDVDCGLSSGRGRQQCRESPFDWAR